MPLADGTKFILNVPILDRRENISVDELKGVPLSRTLRLEVPPEPALCLGLKGRDLGLDVTSGVGPVRVGPLGEVVVPGAVADVGAAGECAVVTGTAVEAV
jgi:hypothetical protein